MQIRTFSLNLGTSNKKFQATKYSLKRPFEKEYEYISKKNFFSKYFRKTLRSNLNLYYGHYL